MFYRLVPPKGAHVVGQLPLADEDLQMLRVHEDRRRATGVVVRHE